MYGFESEVRYSEVDADRHMTLTALLDILQDCCIFQSEHLGVGLDYLEEKERAWVLSSWQVVIKRYPTIGEKITTYTWAYDCKAFYGYRNFKILDNTGEMIAYANSVWVFLDTKHMRPAKISQDIIDAFAMEPSLPMEKMERKLKPAENSQTVEPVPVHKFFIDTNMHVNNSKYVLIAQEYLPEGFKIGELRVEYKKAAVLSDVFYPKVGIEADKVTVSLENKEEEPFAVVEFIKL